MTRARQRAGTFAGMIVSLAMAGPSSLGCSNQPAATTKAAPAPASAGAAAAAPAGPAASAAPAAASAAPAAAAPAAPALAAGTPVPAATRQLVLAVVDDWGAVSAELSRWTRDHDAAPWQRVAEPWPGVIGSGAAWGSGLHGDGPPAGQEGASKREGDGRSPAGVFALGGAYGYADRAPKGTRWRYTPVDRRWVCVDDSASRAYGTIVETSTVEKDWTSSEAMARRDALYTWVVEVAHNPAHVAAGGSCIFLHVWRKADSPTVGCTAMERGKLEDVLAWLDPEARPVFVLLPKASYAALAAPWGLPAR